jgi:hypothetical protein
VGKAAETHFLMGDEYFAAWGPEFERRLGSRDADARGPVTVGEVRGWIAGMEPKVGLTREVADLVILAWAALRRRAWYHHGATIDAPKPGALRDDMELREQPMPSEDEWATAIRLAGSIFGLTSSTHATPSAVANLAQAVRAKAIEWSEPSARLVTALEAAGRSVGLDESRPNQRLATARAAADLCDVLRGLNGLPLIKRLAAADIPQATATGRSLASAGAVAAKVTGYDWHRFAPLITASSGEGERADEAAGILTRLREALMADEFTTQLAPAITNADRELFDWLARRNPVPRITDPRRGDDEGSRLPKGGRTLFRGRGGLSRVSEQLREFVDEHPDQNVVVEWRVE